VVSSVAKSLLATSTSAGERTHQRRLAGIGVTDQRDAGEPLTILPSRALRLALDVHGVDFQLQLGDAVANLASVHFGVRFAGAASAESAALPPLRPGELGCFAQARCHVAKTGDFDLRPGCARTRVAVEDFEDDHGAVHHLAADLQLKVARLRGRNFVVDQKDFDGFTIQTDRCCRPIQLGAVVPRIDAVIDEATDFLPLADTEIAGPVKAGALLDEGTDDLEPQRLGEFAQLSDRGVELVIAHARQLHGSNHG